MFKINPLKDFIYVTQQRDRTTVWDSCSITTLWNRTHMCFFPKVGAIPKIRDWLNKENRGVESAWANSLSIQLFIQSGSVALQMGRALRTESASSQVTTILLYPTPSNRGNSGRDTFSSFNIVCLQQKSFKTLALSKSFEYIVSSWSEGGIDEL